jgi:hypothetical protein
MVRLHITQITTELGTEIVKGSDATRANCFFVAWYSEEKKTIYLNCSDPKKLLPPDVVRIGFRRTKRKR